MLTSLLWTLLALYALIVLAWVWGFWRLRSFRVDEQMTLAPAAEWSYPVAPRVAVIIAAHNEEQSIESCVQAILSQTYPNLRVVVANDRSEDDTSGIVERLARQDSRVDLVEVRQLPDGWIGKTHALAQAAKDVDADYLLFVDSDVRLVPGAINAVMQKVVGEQLDFLSLWPSLELLSPAERLLTPPAGWLLSFWAILSSGLGADASEIRLGNGQFMLFSRATYRRIGGHAGVQAELAEDAMMACKVADLGVNRWAGLGRGLYVTSRDGSLSRTCNAIARVVIGSLCKPWRVLASTQILLGGCVLPLWVPLPGLYAGISFGSTIGYAFAGAGALHFLAMLGVLKTLFSLTLVKRGSVLWFPFGCAILVGLLVWSTLIMTGRGRVRWGKTYYAVRGSRILHALGDQPRVATTSR